MGLGPECGRFFIIRFADLCLGLSYLLRCPPSGLTLVTPLGLPPLGVFFPLNKYSRDAPAPPPPRRTFPLRHPPTNEGVLMWFPRSCSANFPPEIFFRLSHGQPTSACPQSVSFPVISASFQFCYRLHPFLVPAIFFLRGTFLASFPFPPSTPAPRSLLHLVGNSRSFFLFCPSIWCASSPVLAPQGSWGPFRLHSPPRQPFGLHTWPCAGWTIPRISPI